MLTTSRKHIIEKHIERDGFVFRVFFAVSNELGHVQAEVIKVVPLGKIEEVADSLLLPITKSFSPLSDIFTKKFELSFVSPFVSQLIYINGSKPRAPTRQI